MTSLKQGTLWVPHPSDALSTPCSVSCPHPSSVSGTVSCVFWNSLSVVCSNFYTPCTLPLSESPTTSCLAHGTCQWSSVISLSSACLEVEQMSSLLHLLTSDPSPCQTALPLASQATSLQHPPTAVSLPHYTIKQGPAVMTLCFASQKLEVLPRAIFPSSNQSPRGFQGSWASLHLQSSPQKKLRWTWPRS